MTRPQHELGQADTLDWLAEIHAASRATELNLDAAAQREFADRLRTVIARCACGPDKIAKRGHVVADAYRSTTSQLELYDVASSPKGKGSAARSALFDRFVTSYFQDVYANDVDAPSDLIHVTCTGYLSPSGAQKLVAAKGWGAQTRVTHAYQMGCYAAFPAVRLAAGALQLPDALSAGGDRRVDIVHTELCSLHLDPSDHSLEQLVVQSLFADGFIRYAAHRDARAGLEVVALHEMLVPDSEGAMSWSVGDAGMHMTLARDVPERITLALRGFVAALFQKAGISMFEALPKAACAIHPGGPKIIEGVRRTLELTQAQVQESHDVLRAYGNMSSATLPHIWMRLCQDPGVAPGTLVLSLAFGPGLTICGGLFRKR